MKPLHYIAVCDCEVHTQWYAGCSQYGDKDDATERINPVTPVSSGVDIEKSVHNDEDWAQSIAHHVQQHTSHVQLRCWFYNRENIVSKIA